MKALLLILATLFVTTAFADDRYYEPTPPTAHGFSVVFKPMSRETNIEEGVWQFLNVIDLLQSIQIAKNPQCYREVGTPALLGSGPHPGIGATIGFAALFGVGHYLVSRGIETLIDNEKTEDHDNGDDYRILQRWWQLGSFVPKAYTVEQNASIGLGLTHSRGCN